MAVETFALEMSIWLFHIVISMSLIPHKWEIKAYFDRFSWQLSHCANRICKYYGLIFVMRIMCLQFQSNSLTQKRRKCNHLHWKYFALASPWLIIYWKPDFWPSQGTLCRLDWWPNDTFVWTSIGWTRFIRLWLKKWLDDRSDIVLRRKFLAATIDSQRRFIGPTK